MLKRYHLLTAIVCGSVATTPLLSQSPDRTARVDSLFAPWNTVASPGAAVAVVEKGNVVFAKGYGAANLEYDVPITPSTVFHVASVSKQFTAFALVLLARQGKISLDDDIRAYVPEIPDFGTRITIRHLAHHTSGLRDQWNLLAMAGWRLDDVITREHILKLVSRQRELNFPPGTEYLYSNSGYTLMAEIVSRVTQQPFAAWMEENVFTPLGMKNTLFYDDHERIVKNRAYSYRPDGGGFKKLVLNYANVGATSLFTTVEDMAKWIGNFGSHTLGGEAAWQTLTTRGVLTGGDTISYALGIDVSSHRGRTRIGHGGGDAGYRSYVGYFPELELGVVVLSNLAWFDPFGMSMQVAEVFARDGFDSPVATASETRSARPDTIVEAYEPWQPSGADIAALEGAYYSPELETSYTVVARDGNLVARHSRHPDIELVPRARYELSAQVWFMGTLTFERNANGTVTGFRASAGRVRHLLFTKERQDDRD